MADNYLERRMEDYRAGRLNAPLRRKANPHSAAPTSEAALSSSRVLILSPSASASARVKALIDMLRAAGCRVAFTDSDARGGQALACASGAQCHPIDFRDEAAMERSREIIIRRWGGIDMTLTVREDSPE